MNKRIYIRKHGCVNRNYSVNLLPKNLMFVVHCAMLFGSPLCQESMWWTRILPSTWAVPVAEALVLFANRLLSFKLLLSGFVMSFWLYTCVCAVWPLHPSLKQVHFRQRFYTESLGMRMPFSLQNWRDVQELTLISTGVLFSENICSIGRLQLCTAGFKKLPVILKRHKNILNRPNHQILVLVAWGRGWPVSSWIQSIWGFHSIYWGFTLLPVSKYWHYWSQSKFSLLYGVILKALCMNCSNWVTAGFNLFCSF